MSPRPSNDVVVLYYQGGSSSEAPGALSPAPSWDGHGEEIDLFRLSEIRERLNETRGAKLFLLDVTHPPNQALLDVAQAAHWIKDDSPFGLLRFSWQGLAAPPDVSLAVTLREALQQKITLEDVSEEVDRRRRSLQSRYPGLHYLPEFTRQFNNLILGGP